MTEEYLPEIIGQRTAKNRLKIYQKSFEKSGRLPFLFFGGAKGQGKSKIAREWRKTLMRQDGTIPPLLEVNAATIKNADMFFDQVFSKWTQNEAILFLDEAHEIPDKLCQVFLTALEKDKNPVRRITYETKDQGYQDYIFDFTKISIIFASTDIQKLPPPLRDRFTKIEIGHYSNDELFEIFKLNLECEVDEKIKNDIVAVFRGHPRACVELAEELDHYASAHCIETVNETEWFEFCNTMGVHPYGLSNSELQLLRVLGERGECSVKALVSSTGFSRSVIMNEYEHALFNKGLVDVGNMSKRSLTRKGYDLYVSLFDRKPEKKPEKVERPDPIQRVEKIVNENNSHPLYRK